MAKTGPVLDLAANTLPELGNKVPEKFEGLAIGPTLGDGGRLLLAGTDNDYSVTQNGSNEQFDVYFRMTDVDPYAGSIQCPLGRTTGCFFTTGGGAATLTGRGLPPASRRAARLQGAGERSGRVCSCEAADQVAGRATPPAGSATRG